MTALSILALSPVVHRMCRGQRDDPCLPRLSARLGFGKFRTASDTRPDRADRADLRLQTKFLGQRNDPRVVAESLRLRKPL